MGFRGCQGQEALYIVLRGEEHAPAIWQNHTGAGESLCFEVNPGKPHSVKGPTTYLLSYLRFKLCEILQYSPARWYGLLVLL